MSAKQTSHDDDLRLALELADIADMITMARHRASDLQVELKPDMTPVTESDQAVELALRERLGVARPGDAVLGEEYGAGTDDGAARQWIIDPIDGTKSYVRGMPTWSTLIALREHGRITVGGRLDARPREALVGDTRRWRLSPTACASMSPAFVELGDAQMAWSGIEDWADVGRLDRIVALGQACWRTRGVGDAWQYMLVAEGIAEIASDPGAEVWDLAAVSLIVEEAGGRFTDMSGAATADGGSGLATNGLLHDAVLEILGTTVDPTDQSLQNVLCLYDMIRTMRR